MRAEVVVDQRDVQKRGGICARYPVACVVADLVREYAPETVVDLTYGYGIFWAASRPRLLVGFDPNRETPRHWVVAPDVFIPHPAWRWRVLDAIGVRPDLLAADPPWTDRPNSRRALYGWIVGTVDMILRAAAEAASHYGAPVLVHYRERWVPPGFEVVREVWFRAVFRASNRDRLTWFAVLEPRR